MKLFGADVKGLVLHFIGVGGSGHVRAGGRAGAAGCGGERE